MIVIINGCEFVAGSKYYFITDKFDVLHGIIHQINVGKNEIEVITNVISDSKIDICTKERLAENSGIYSSRLDAQIDSHQIIINRHG